MKHFLKDKRALYVIGILAFMNLIGYIMLHNTDAIIFFFVVGLLTAHFNKNMIVVLLSSMIFTNLLISIKYSTRREGMKNSKKEAYSGKNKLRPKKVASKKLHDDSHDDSHDGSHDDSHDETHHDTQDEEEEEAPSQPRKPQRRSRGVKKPQKGVAAASEDLTSEMSGQNSILDNAANIPNPQDLAKYQTDLANNIKNLGPMMESAQAMMKALGGKDGMTKIIQGFASMNHS